MDEIARYQHTNVHKIGAQPLTTKGTQLMNKHLQHCVERTIKKEFVSVYHDYDNRETIYNVPYNAALTPRSVRLILIRAMGLDYSDEFDESDPHDIDKMSWYLVADETPMFSLVQGHTINKRGVLMTNYRLDFNGEVLFQKSYPSESLSRKNTMLQLIRKCSDKIIDQERTAQQYKMEKMFVSTNMFTEYAQHGKM